MIIRDKELIKDVIVKDFDNFNDNGLEYDEKIEKLYSKLFMSNGSKWREIRKKM
jgi:hypothetical protein